MTDTIKISRELRPVLSMILNALDRDAADGKAARGEMAAELRALLAAQPSEPQGGDDLGEVVHIGQVSLALLHMNKKGMCSVYGHAYPDTVPLMTVAQHQRITAALRGEVGRLRAMINTPHTDEWFGAVRLEAAHQIERWGTSHDEGKTPADWFWLLGYLSQKAMTAQLSGDEEKAKHHTISSGAMLLNWFRAMAGDSYEMRPG